VNQQIRNETAGLEVQYNRMEFPAFPNKHETDMKSLYVFAGRCATQKLKWLTHVVLAPPPDLTVPSTKQLATLWLQSHTKEVIELLSFGRAHPHIRIDFHFPYFTHAAPSTHSTIGRFMQTGILLSLLFHGINLSAFDKPIYTASTYETPVSSLFAADPRATLTRLGKEAKNLKLFPTDTEIDEKAFETAI
jgi:hypothetical protein